MLYEVITPRAQRPDRRGGDRMVALRNADHRALLPRDKPAGLPRQAVGLLDAYHIQQPAHVVGAGLV